MEKVLASKPALCRAPGAASERNEPGDVSQLCCSLSVVCFWAVSPAPRYCLFELSPTQIRSIVLCFRPHWCGDEADRASMYVLAVWLFSEDSAVGTQQNLM